MGVKDKALALFKRVGAPARFAARLTLGALLPGSPAVVDLVCSALDCVHETARDNLEFDAAKMRPASDADLQRVEQVLDVLNGDLAALLAQLAHLEKMPDVARQNLDTALATDERCRQAARRLDELARRFDRLEEQNRRLLEGQGYAAGMLEEMLPLLRRVAGVADLVEELCAAGAGLAGFRGPLHAFRDGARALGLGHVAEAEPLLLELVQAQPRSGVSAAALAAAQAAAQDLPAAEKSLARAARLRPADAEVAELHRRVTVASRGATPVPSASPAQARRRVKAGDVLDGWRLEQMLGSGGWGQVFRARRGDRVRAIKVMHPELSADARFVERFRAEILTLARLSGRHRHLVEIDGFGYAADAACWYFSMEFIDGPSLEEYLRRRGVLSLPQARRLFFAVAEGLAAAHAEGIVHRDIKPANILLRRPDGAPVLIDFGLASLADGRRLTTAGRPAGHTPMFAAPEQLRGRSSDFRSDVYSLAASLYYALVYDRPALREPHLFDPEHVPQELRPVLIEALHQNPDRRTQSIAAFGNAIRATADKPVEVEIKILGRWRARPTHDPEAEWTEITETPATVQVIPGQVYLLRVSVSVSHAELAGLAHLRGLAELYALDLSYCSQITDAGLAHLTGLTGLQILSLQGCESITDAGLTYLTGLSRLQQLDLSFCERITDAGLAHLRGLTGLQELDLSFCQRITDTGLDHLQEFTGLQALNLLACKRITDAGMAHLRKLTGLQELDLSGARITDAGLAHLQGLTRLQTLKLRVCERITDAGLAHLRKLIGLQRLDLSSCGRITDAGLAHLRVFTGLRTLKLWGCWQITDAGLAHLRKLTELRELDLSYCKQITDTGLVYLHRITGLQTLILSDCKQITDLGLKAFLKAASPDCKVER